MVTSNSTTEKFVYAKRYAKALQDRFLCRSGAPGHLLLCDMVGNVRVRFFRLVVRVPGMYSVPTRKWAYTQLESISIQSISVQGKKMCQFFMDSKIETYFSQFLRMPGFRRGAVPRRWSLGLAKNKRLFGYQGFVVAHWLWPRVYDSSIISIRIIAHD